MRCARRCEMTLLADDTTTGTYVLQSHDLLLDQPVTGPGLGYVLKVRDLPEAEKPREKLLAAGPGALNLAELVAVLWGAGTRREDVLAMARRTVYEYGEKAVGSARNPQQLAEAAGIPLHKACQLVAGYELGRRL